MFVDVRIKQVKCVRSGGLLSVCVVWATALSLTSPTMVLCTVGCRLSILSTEVPLVSKCVATRAEGCVQA